MDQTGAFNSKYNAADLTGEFFPFSGGGGKVVILWSKIFPPGPDEDPRLAADADGSSRPRPAPGDRFHHRQICGRDRRPGQPAAPGSEGPGGDEISTTPVIARRLIPRRRAGGAPKLRDEARLFPTRSTGSRRSAPVARHVYVAVAPAFPVGHDESAGVRRRNLPLPRDPNVAGAIKGPVARNPQGIGGGRGADGLGGSRRRRRNGFDHPTIAIGAVTGPGRVIIERAALVIDAVADGAAGDRTQRATEDRTAEGVTPAAVVTDDRAGDGAQSAAVDGALLGVGTDAHATAEEQRQNDRRNKKGGFIHG